MNINFCTKIEWVIDCSVFVPKRRKIVFYSVAIKFFQQNDGYVGPR